VKHKVDSVWQEVVISSQNLRKWTEITMGNFTQRTQYKGTDLNSALPYIRSRISNFQKRNTQSNH